MENFKGVPVVGRKTSVHKGVLVLHILPFQRRCTKNDMAAKGKIKIDQVLCKACELCITVCPEEAIRLSAGLNDKGYHPAEFCKDSCKGCALCAVMCPEVVIEVFRE